LFQEILKIGCPILIEADGARRLPMKAPAEHEPVIWAETTHVLNVYGLDTLGKKLEDVCFRAELAATLLNKEVTDVVECFDIAKLAQLSAVESKGVLPKMRYHIVLNKADTDALFEQAKQIANLLEENAISELTVTSRSEIQPCEEVLEE
jgi:probable selenium-dependent hydroxylase accessory protein YqeC